MPMMRRSRVMVGAALLAQIPFGTEPLGAQAVPSESHSRAPASAAAPRNDLPANTTVVPRSAKEQRPPPGPAGAGQVKLVAVLTDDGQAIEQGLVWRVFRDKPGPDGKPVLVEMNRDTAPTLRLAPGDYIVNVAFGRANLTRRISVGPEQGGQERFVLNA